MHAFLNAIWKMLAVLYLYVIAHSFFIAEATDRVCFALIMIFFDRGVKTYTHTNIHGQYLCQNYQYIYELD